ncbi:conserved oligomeric Golgi complex component, partial [Cladochytrium tenue]
MASVVAAAADPHALPPLVTTQLPGFRGPGGVADVNNGGHHAEATSPLSPSTLPASVAASAARPAAGTLHGHELLVTLLLESHRQQLQQQQQEQEQNTANAASAGANGADGKRASLDPDTAASRIDRVFSSVIQDSHTLQGDAHLHERRRSSSASSTKGSPSVRPAPLQWTVFRDPEFLAYLDRLASIGLDAARREPDRLAADVAQVEAALAELAFSEHRSFLEANACSQSVDRQLRRAHAGLGRFSDAAPRAASAALACRDACRPAAEDRRRLAALLAAHERVLEVLEIPALMDTFVRNGNYDEAMELQAHVTRLVARHPHLGVLQGVATQVRASTDAMLAQLVGLLRGSTKLPLCIRIIGHLRRLEAYSEPELRVVFLQEKDAHFRSLLAGIVDRDPFEYLRKYVEISREHFFDIVTQYRAIFSDAPTSSSATGAEAAADGASGSSSSITATILSSYASHTVDAFLAKLAEKVPQIRDATLLNSLATQTMYYGMSLGRVGMDFRDAIAQLFVDSVDRIVRTTIETGVVAFQDWCRAAAAATSAIVAAGGSSRRVLSPASSRESLATNPPAAGHAGVSAIRVRSSLAGALGVLRPDASETGSSSYRTSISATTTVAAPAHLLSFPPLAHLANAYFTAFNQLRVSAPVALHAPLLALVTDSLRVAATALASLAVAIPDDPVAAGIATSDDDDPRAALHDAARAFADILAPAVLAAFEAHAYGAVTSALAPAGPAPADNYGDGGDEKGALAATAPLASITSPLAPLLVQDAPPPESKTVEDSTP